MTPSDLQFVNFNVNFCQEDSSVCIVLAGESFGSP
jgi:hypothetical protein